MKQLWTPYVLLCCYDAVFTYASWNHISSTSCTQCRTPPSSDSFVCISMDIQCHLIVLHKTNISVLVEITTESSAVITRSNIVRCCINNLIEELRQNLSQRLEPKTYTPYLALTGEQKDFFCKYLWQNWPRCNVTALYLEFHTWIIWIWLFSYRIYFILIGTNPLNVMKFLLRSNIHQRFQKFVVSVLLQE